MRTPACKPVSDVMGDKSLIALQPVCYIYNFVTKLPTEVQITEGSIRTGPGSDNGKPGNRNSTVLRNTVIKKFVEIPSELSRIFYKPLYV